MEILLTLFIQLIPLVNESTDVCSQAPKLNSQISAFKHFTGAPVSWKGLPQLAFSQSFGLPGTKLQVPASTSLLSMLLRRWGFYIFTHFFFFINMRKPETWGYTIYNIQKIYNCYTERTLRGLSQQHQDKWLTDLVSEEGLWFRTCSPFKLSPSTTLPASSCRCFATLGLDSVIINEIHQTRS